MGIKPIILNIIRSFIKFKPLEKMLCRMTIGKTLGTLITKLPPNHYQYKKGSLRRVTRNGIHYYMDISDLIDWYIYWGFKERAREKLYSLIKEGYFIVDIGANVGAVTFNCAMLAGKKGHILSFEPDPVNFNRLQRNFNLNKFENIELINKALGNKVDKGFIKIKTERNLGENRISDKGTPINITTLDDFLKDKSLYKIDLIKIDTEGYELHVLKGALETIKTYRPKLFIEMDDKMLKEQGASAIEMIILLESLGYKLANAETCEVVTQSQNYLNTHFDIIGIMETA